MKDKYASGFYLLQGGVYHYANECQDLLYSITMQMNVKICYIVLEISTIM